MSQPIIEVRQLSKRYQLGEVGFSTLRDEIARGWERFRNRNHSVDSQPEKGEFWALRDISFDVQPGEIMGIIGRNGAGKSTLLKILSRITEPTFGEAILRGRVASLLEVGTGFNPELTGRENIFLNGTILGMKKREISDKLDEIIAFAEIAQHIDTPVKRYSSGMYVRLAFAVAAHLEPEILIVDEVLAVGDAQFQNKCLGKMQDVSKSGRTILFVSHNMGAMQALCTKACYLQKGKVKAVGEVETLVSEYQRDGNIGNGGHFAEPIKLGTNLELLKMQFTPESVKSGNSIQFTIAFKALTSIRISDLSLVIYSEQGIRVAILDFRACGLPLSYSGETAWNISGEIKALTLVDGTYSAGLYVRSDNHMSTTLDLSRFSVSPSNDTEAIVSYLPAHRGFVDLAFNAQIL